MLGIGIDTGGTCTDAVIYDMDTKEILATGKTLTTKSNLEIGIAKALDELPDELLKQAGSFSLSTTLATNASVENKGSRAKLLIIGATPEMMERLSKVLSGYGINDMSQLIVLDAKPENLFSNSFDPDWDELKEKAPDLFSDCDCVGIVQTYPDANGGRFEMTALKILEGELSIPVTIAFDISKETDILKVCASTLLNARLIPLIANFMQAVHNVMDARHLDVPLYIVRSDGTLMSEEMAKTCPVETLLCGPAASVIGGCTLAQEENAIVVDMGGTTTDLALIRNNEALLAPEGIMIGQYKTAIKGLNAQAISLGGDTAVRHKDGKLYLDTERVIPISVLAEAYPSVLEDIRKLAKDKLVHTRQIHEFYVLQKGIDGKTGYTDFERQVCEVLKEKPLITKDFVKVLNTDLYHLDTARLEQEGIIIKSGITPTDMMIIKGDFGKYDGEAAKEALKHIALNINKDENEIPDIIYEFVTRRMYKNIASFLMRKQYPEKEDFYSLGQGEAFFDTLYEQAVTRINNPEYLTSAFSQIPFVTQMPLIGIGAPIHVFLNRVAALLGTRAIIPEYAHVANALGAAAGRLLARADVSVLAKYDGYSCYGYAVVKDYKLHIIKRLDDAIAFATEIAEEEIKEKAAFQGLGENPVISISQEEIRIGHRQGGLLLEVLIHATAKIKD